MATLKKTLILIPGIFCLSPIGTALAQSDVPPMYVADNTGLSQSNHKASRKAFLGHARSSNSDLPPEYAATLQQGKSEPLHEAFVGHAVENTNFNSNSAQSVVDLKAAPGAAADRNRVVYYAGLFVGTYDTDFLWTATYYSPNAVDATQIFYNTLSQVGGAYGGQLGLFYHFDNPYLLGINFTGVGNNNSAYVTNHVFPSITGVANTYSLDERLKVLHSYDLNLFFGFDVSPASRLYVKLGGARAEVQSRLTVTSGVGVGLNPTVNYIYTDTRNMWGIVSGVGLTQQLYDYLDAFIEFDQYYYFPRTLDERKRIDPIGTLEQDLIDNQVKLSAYSFRLGVNVKFNDSFSPIMHSFVGHPFQYYFAPVVGAYQATFQYEGLYSTTRIAPGSNALFKQDPIQSEYTLGGQLAALYHFTTPYFVGLSARGMYDSGDISFNLTPERNFIPTNTAFNFIHTMKLDYNIDVSALFGFDVTSILHASGKVGVSFAGLRDGFKTVKASSGTAPNAPNTFFTASEKSTLTGLVVGLNMQQDLNQWLNAFVEYDHYYYGNHNLSSYDGITQVVVASTDSLTQKVNVSADTVLFGVNAVMNGQYKPTRYNLNLLSQVQHAPYNIYLGVFGAYYNALYRYALQYSANSGNQPPSFIQAYNKGSQLGYSAGGQVGFLARNPGVCFWGLGLSAAGNGSLAHTVQHIDFFVASNQNNFDIVNEFKINYMVDIFGQFGVDVNPLLHLYLKLGASYGNLSQNLFTRKARFIALTLNPYRQLSHHNLWGAVGGFGFSRDFGDRYTFFAEYDGYFYPNQNLISAGNIATNVQQNQVIDQLLQSVNVRAYTVRAGFNVNFDV